MLNAEERRQTAILQIFADNTYLLRNKLGIPWHNPGIEPNNMIIVNLNGILSTQSMLWLRNGENVHKYFST